MAYRYEIQERIQYTRARGQGHERKGGRNGGTFHGDSWKQRAVTNDREAALECIHGLDSSWRVFDHQADCALVA